MGERPKGAAMKTYPFEFDGIDHIVLRITDRERTLRFYGEILGLHIERIIEDSERDFYMDPDGALKYGIVDHIAKPSHLNATAEAKSTQMPAPV